MKFHVKNRFIFNGITKYPGEIIEVFADKVSELSKANVLGAPVKEIQIETAVIKPIENEIINRKVIKRGKK